MSFSLTSIEESLGARSRICFWLVSRVSALANLTFGSYCAGLRSATFAATSGLA
jgi:hypothetical protein